MAANGDFFSEIGSTVKEIREIARTKSSMFHTIQAKTDELTNEFQKFTSFSANESFTDNHKNEGEQELDDGLVNYDFEYLFGLLADMQTDGESMEVEIAKLHLTGAHAGKSKICANEFKRNLACFLAESQFSDLPSNALSRIELFLNYIIVANSMCSKIKRFAQKLVMGNPWNSSGFMAKSNLEEELADFVAKTFLQNCSIYQFVNILSSIVRSEESKFRLFDFQDASGHALARQIFSGTSVNAGSTIVSWFNQLKFREVNRNELARKAYLKFCNDVETGIIELKVLFADGTEAKSSDLNQIVIKLKELEGLLQLTDQLLATKIQTYQANSVRLQASQFIAKTFAFNYTQEFFKPFNLDNQENLERILSQASNPNRKQILVDNFTAIVTNISSNQQSTSSSVSVEDIRFSKFIFTLLADALIAELTGTAFSDSGLPINSLAEEVKQLPSEQPLLLLDSYLGRSNRSEYLTEHNTLIANYCRVNLLGEYEPFFNVASQDEAFWRTRSNILKYLKLRQTYGNLIEYRLLPFEAVAQNYNFDKLKAMYKRLPLLPHKA